MADLAKTIQIIFDGVDNTDGVIGKIGSDMGALAGAAQSVTGPIADFTRDLLLIETAGAAAGVAMAALATIAAGEFNDSFREISTLVDASDASLASFRDQLLDYASQSTQAFGDITTATYNAISAGVDYEDALKALALAEQLAIAGKTDLNTAMELLVPTLNAYGAGMDEASRYADVLFQTVVDGKTTLPELSAALGKVTSTAAAAGVPIEQIAAAIATLTANGLSTSEAVTYLNSALNSILKPSTAAAAAADEMGVAMGGSALASEGLVGWLEQVIAATGGNVDEVGKLIGAQEGFKAVLSLTGDGLDKYNQKLDNSRTSAGRVGEAADKMAESFELTNQRMRNAVNGFLVESGEPLERRWGEIGAAVSAIFDALRNSVDDGTFADIYEAIDAFALRVIAKMQELARNLPEALKGLEWGGLLEAFQDLGTEVGRIFEDVDLSTPEGLRAAIQGLIDVGTRFVEVTSGIVVGFGPFIDALVAAVSAFSELDSGVTKSAGEMMGLATGFDTALRASGPFLDSIAGLASALQALVALNVATKIAAIGSAAVASAGGAAALAKSMGAVAAVLAAGYGGWKAGEGLLSFINDKLIPGTDTLGTRLYDINEAFRRFFGADPDIDPSFWVDTFDELGRSVAEVEDTATAAERFMSDLVAAVFNPVDAFGIDAAFWGNVSHAFGRDMADIKTEADSAERVFADLVKAAFNPIDSYGIGGGIWGDLAETLGITATASEDAAGSMGEYVRAIKDAEGNIIGYEQAGRRVADSSRDQAKAAEEAAKATLDYQIKLAELASNERIRLIEARVELDIAKAQANAEIMVSAFESINATIASTGEVLTGLYDIWAGAGSIRDKFQVEKWIKEENRRRDEALEQQKKLIEAQVKEMEARAKVLEKGGGEIKITMDGLEPELEALMFKVIDRARVAVAESYDDFLLGCSS